MIRLAHHPERSMLRKYRRTSPGNLVDRNEESQLSIIMLALRMYQHRMRSRRNDVEP